jgi:hypothetical protein
MSQLAVYQPEFDQTYDEPVILSFDAYYEPETINFQDALLQRARQMKANQSCPQCHSAQILPLETYRRRTSSAYRSMTSSSSMNSEYSCQCCHWSWKAR